VFQVNIRLWFLGPAPPSLGNSVSAPVLFHFYQEQQIVIFVKPASLSKCVFFLFELSAYSLLLGVVADFQQGL
jgi:hypothetical protein